jgi:phosphonate transport system ATP-binding protein
MIWQHAALVRRRSVLANVACGALGRHQTIASAMGLLPAVEQRAAADFLHQVGLPHLAAQRWNTVGRPGATRGNRPSPGAAAHVGAR